VSAWLDNINAEGKEDAHSKETIGTRESDSIRLGKKSIQHRFTKGVY
jgi:hypothetical protein